jgi:hypothetical protein
MLAVAAREEADGACHELEETARDFAAPALDAMAGQARGALQLAEGDAAAALGSLRGAASSS